MKIVAKFIGRVNLFNSPPEPSYVTLKNIDTGEVCDTDAVSEKLLEKGIDHTDCEFEVLIQQGDDGKHTAVLNKLEPRKISKEELETIRKEVDDKLKGFGEVFTVPPDFTI